MTVEQIKDAVRAGKTVHWVNTRYVVVVDKYDQWLITCDDGDAIGLTDWEGELNGQPSEFYIA